MGKGDSDCKYLRGKWVKCSLLDRYLPDIKDGHIIAMDSTRQAINYVYCPFCGVRLGHIAKMIKKFRNDTITNIVSDNIKLE